MTVNQRDLIAAIITLFIAEKVKDEDVITVATNDPRVVINTYKRVREKVSVFCEELENESNSNN